MRDRGNMWLYIVMVIAMATWGLSWTNGKILGEYTSIPLLMFWRFIIAAVSMVPVILVTKTTFRLDWRPGLGILLSSILIMLYNVFYFSGTKLGSAGAGGVLVTTLNPVLTFILVSLVQRVPPRGRSLVGILLGIVGGTIIIGIWGAGWEAVLVRGNHYFLLCASSWAILTLLSQKVGRSVHVFTYSFYLYLVSSLFSLLWVEEGRLFSVFDLELRFWINLLLISVGAMAFGTTAYFLAASRLGSSKASAFTFTVPVTAMLFSMLILKEALLLNVLLGGVFSIIAVYLINSQGNLSSKKSA